jgi:hypothetical protein
MNKDNLIEFAKEQCEIFPEDSYMGEYLRKTIKMLQAEPCEDVVSRSQALKELEESAKHHANDSREEVLLRRDRDIIRALPPVTPKGVTVTDFADRCRKCGKRSVTNREKKVEMEKHTDRQIYDGCIHLMQKMVDYFQEYLEYLGYDIDRLDEDERFAVGMYNMEIVRQLFLQHTRNSGGCSTMDFCEKLGVDPYKRVKFELDWYEEE